MHTCFEVAADRIALEQTRKKYPHVFHKDCSRMMSGAMNVDKKDARADLEKLETVKGLPWSRGT